MNIASRTEASADSAESVDSKAEMMEGVKVESLRKVEWKSSWWSSSRLSNGFVILLSSVGS